MNGQYEQKPSITEEYEQKALAAWRSWYQRAHPTLSEASGQAAHVARETVGSLTTAQVLHLLQEHPGWIHLKPRERYDSDKLGFATIGEITRRHVVKYLEQVIQNKGFQAIHQEEAQ